MSDRRPTTGKRHQAGRRTAGLLVFAAAIASPARGAPADDPSAVVVIGGLEPEGALAAAGSEVPGHWRLETLVPRAIPAGISHARLDTLARTYREADFLRCLTGIDDTLDPDLLLQLGHRAEAARAGTLAAACALGAGDEGRARDLLRRLSARELVESNMLRRTTPAFQRIADEERQAAQRRGWVAVDVNSDPDGASIHVNGVKRCPAAPCRVHLLRGEHLLVAHKLGHRSRTLTPVLERDHAVTMKLDPASADETRRQLATALGAGIDPSGVEIPRATASAFGVGMLVLVWARDWQVHAAAYQAGSPTLTHVAVDGREATPRAVAAALHGWRATVGSQTQARANRASISMFSELVFWLMGVAVAFASIALAFRLHRSKQVRHGVAFR
jgi:PEGA domain-containing protein